MGRTNVVHKWLKPNSSKQFHISRRNGKYVQGGSIAYISNAKK